MKQPGLNQRHRDRNGEISRKHGNTLIGTLRRVYGSSFAPKAKDTDKLSDVLHDMVDISLSQLVRHHEQGVSIARSRKQRQVHNRQCVASRAAESPRGASGLEQLAAI
jgi:hypothetical protein